MFAMILRNFRGKKIVDLLDVDLSEKTIIVTGSNTGLGFHTVLALSKLKATIYVACRNEKKALDAIESIKKVNPSAKLHFCQLDLADLTSILNFVKEFTEIKVDILIHNAGIIKKNLEEDKVSKDNFEMMFAVNCLGTYYLTKLMIPLMIKNGKIIPGYFYHYSVTKLFMIWLTYKLHEDYNEKTGISFNALHPGVIKYTELTRVRKKNENFEDPLKKQPPETKKLVQGIQTTLHVALKCENISGKYFDNCEIVNSSDFSYDKEYQEKIFNLCEDLIKDFEKKFPEDKNESEKIKVEVDKKGE